MPFFKDTAIGCYVRIGIGAHDGKMVYRVSTILYCTTEFGIWLICKGYFFTVNIQFNFL